MHFWGRIMDLFKQTPDRISSVFSNGNGVSDSVPPSSDSSDFDVAQANFKHAIDMARAATTGITTNSDRLREMTSEIKNHSIMPPKT